MRGNWCAVMFQDAMDITIYMKNEETGTVEFFG